MYMGRDGWVVVVGRGKRSGSHEDPLCRLQSLDPAIGADGARRDGGWAEVGETLVDVTVLWVCAVPDRREGREEEEEAEMAGLCVCVVEWSGVECVCSRVHAGGGGLMGDLRVDCQF